MSNPTKEDLKKAIDTTRASISIIDKQIKEALVDKNNQRFEELVDEKKDQLLIIKKERDEFTGWIKERIGLDERDAKDEEQHKKLKLSSDELQAEALTEDINQIELEIDVVQLEIRVVEHKVKLVVGGSKELQVLQEKEKQLRVKEQQLRDELKQLKVKEQQLRDEKRTQLSAQSKNVVEPSAEFPLDEQYYAALKRAKQFATAIMKDLEDIPVVEGDEGVEGMRVMRDIPNLETGININIVIRTCTEPFWQKCIKLVNDRDTRTRVCAIGSPGIGKTTCTPFLIRMLLKQDKPTTVIYLIRSEARNRWYYEFSNKNNNITVKILPEKCELYHIESLKSPSAYYIVDPRKTKNSCDPDVDFPLRVIIVTSPNPRHWGGKEFVKARGLDRGCLLFYPVWKLNEILCARSFINNTLCKADAIKRFRRFGGIPRYFLHDSGGYQTNLLEQETAIRLLTKDQAEEIAMGTIENLNTIDSTQPKSAVLVYGFSEREQPENTFLKPKVQVVSPLVAEQIYAKFMKTLWNSMIASGQEGHQIFEAYTRALMASTSQKFTCRQCSGKSSSSDPEASFVELGGCSEIRLSLNIVDSALKCPNILYHSVDRQYELIDFAYMNTNGDVYAFQATIGASHKSKDDALLWLAQHLSTENKQWFLFYLVPGEQFKSFVTKHVKPQKPKNLKEIYHVLIPDPNKEKS